MDTDVVINPDRLRALMEQRGITQQELADAAGMRQQGIQAILAGRSKRPRKLKEIAEALSTSQDYLLSLTDDPEPAPSASEFFEVYARLSAADRRELSALAAKRLAGQRRA